MEMMKWRKTRYTLIHFQGLAQEIQVSYAYFKECKFTSASGQYDWHQVMVQIFVHNKDFIFLAQIVELY